jgi:hypothetical protein
LTLKEEALDRAQWRTRFWRFYGPVEDREQNEWHTVYPSKL